MKEKLVADEAITDMAAEEEWLISRKSKTDLQGILNTNSLVPG